MRADISPLILAKTALKASEDYERHGHMDEALAWALEAAKQAQTWAESIRGTQKVGEQAAPPSPKGELP